MPVDQLTGQWHPSLSPKQNEFRWAVCPSNPNKKKFHCISGPRRSSKTWAVLQAIAEHCWLVKDAHVSIIVPTMSAGVDGGVWQILTERIIPEWIEGAFGMDWVKEPHISGSTKKPMFTVTNAHGGTSKVQLDSMREGERQISQAYKGKIFSMIVISEASNWVQELKTFLLLIECFRVPNLPTQQHTMIIDTNPAEDGARHWIYQLFYQTRIQEDIEEQMKPLQKQLHLTEFFIADNPYLSSEDVALMKASYSHNPDLWNRYFLGKWTAASGDGIFHQVFRPMIHVLGDVETLSEPDPDTLVPEENCFELITGWDPGDVNHAVTILEPYKQLGKDGRSVETAFKVLDELVLLDSDMTIGDITEEVLIKMEFWKAQLGREIRWTHFSDRSVFDYRDSISARYQHSEVFARSHGKIALQAIPKFDGSVRQRIDFLRKLLFQDRLFISNRRCPKIIESIQGLRKGKNSPIAPGNIHKHAFDALTYGISGVCYDEMEKAVRTAIAKPEKSEPILVSL